MDGMRSTRLALAVLALLLAPAAGDDPATEILFARLAERAEGPQGVTARIALGTLDGIHEGARGPVFAAGKEGLAAAPVAQALVVAADAGGARLQLELLPGKAWPEAAIVRLPAHVDPGLFRGALYRLCALDLLLTDQEARLLTDPRVLLRATSDEAERAALGRMVETMHALAARIATLDKTVQRGRWRGRTFHEIAAAFSPEDCVALARFVASRPGGLQGHTMRFSSLALGWMTGGCELAPADMAAWLASLGDPARLEEEVRALVDYEALLLAEHLAATVEAMEDREGEAAKRWLALLEAVARGRDAKEKGLFDALERLRRLVQSPSAAPLVEVELICRVGEIFPAGRDGSLECLVPRGTAHGLVAGGKGDLYGRAASGGLGEVIGRVEIVAAEPGQARLRLLAGVGTNPAAVVPGVHASLIALVPADLFRGTVYELYAKGIVFLDNGEAALVPSAKLARATSDAVERRALEAMVLAGREVVEFCGEMRDPLTRPRYRGKLVGRILEEATPEDYLGFLRFVLDYPGKYIGKEWKISETFATWLLNNAPPAHEDRVRELRALPPDAPLDRAGLGLKDDEVLYVARHLRRRISDLPPDQLPEAEARLRLLERLVASFPEPGDELQAERAHARARVFDAQEGRYEEAAEAYRAAAAIYLRVGSVLEGIVCLNNAATQRYASERYDDALAEAAAVRELAARELAGARDPQTAAHIPLQEAYAIRLQALIASARGEYRNVVEELMPIADRYAQVGVHGAREKEIDLLDLVARARRKLGEQDEAVRLYDRMDRLARELRDTLRQAKLAFELGDAHYEARRYADALEQFRRSAALARRAGDKREEARALGAAGQSLWNLGRRLEALETHEAGMRLREETGDRSGLAWQLQQAASIRTGMGDREIARGFLERAAGLRRELGQKKGEAELRTTLGELERALSQFDRAVAHYEAALALYRELGWVPDQASALEQLARTQLDRRDYESAAARAGEAILLYAAMGDRDQLASSHYWRAMILRAAGERTAAREALARAAESATDEHWRRLFCGIGLARVAFDEGALDEGLRLATDALAAAEESGDVEQRLEALGCLRDLWGRAGELQKALDISERIVALARESGKRPALVDALAQKAWILADVGQLADARAAATVAMPLAESNDDPVQKAWLLNTLAKIADDYGEWGETLRLYDLAIPLMQGNPYGEAAIVFNRSLQFVQLRDFEAALRENRRAEEIAGKLSTAELSLAILMARGWIFRLRGDSAEAERVLRDALDRARATIRTFVPRVLSELGSVLSERGDHDAAIAALEEAATIEFARPGKPFTALAELGIALVRAGRDAEAAPRLREAVDRATSRGGTIPWDALHHLALVQARAGEPEQALATLERAVREIERGDVLLADDRAKARYRSDKMGVYKLQLRLLLDRGRVEDALVCLERSKVTELKEVDRRSGTGGDPAAALGAELEVQESRLQAHLDEALARENPDEAKVQRLDELLLGVKRRRAEFLESLDRDNALFDRFAVRPLHLEKLREHIAEGTLVLSPIVLEDRVIVFAVTPRVITHFEAPAGSTEIAALVEAFLSEVDPRGLARGLDLPRGEDGREVVEASLARVRVPARRLYDLLLRPALDAVGTPTTLVVSAGGVLRYLPFAALLDGETWVVERMRVLNVTGLDREKLAVERARTDGPLTILALADPDGSLPGARREVAALQRVFEHAVVFTGAEATAATLRQKVRIPGFDVVHFATHGRLDALHPERSHILLAGESLTYPDIPALSPRRTRLVVLSACETAVRAGGTGVEVAGLAYQFQRTKIESVLATLWSVDDAATCDLMDRFYTGLRDGLAPADALAAAQRALARGPELRWRHPAYWAAFILMGPP